MYLFYFYFGSKEICVPKISIKYKLFKMLIEKNSKTLREKKWIQLDSHNSTYTYALTHLQV